MIDIKKRVGAKVLSKRAKLSRLWGAMAEAMRPKPITDFDVWCDENIVIPSESSSQPGTWKTDTFPFWKTPMKLMTPHKHCRELTFMKGCQVAATTVMIAHTMYIPNQYPSPSMLAQATKDAAEEFSTTKWEPFVKGNPCVTNSLGSGRPKGYTNTTLRKTYPGGFLVMNGINNTNFTKGKSVRYIYLDEEDSYEISSKDDGNNIEVTKKRANNYPDSIVIRGTTPKITETSTNYQAFQLGSQERYYMPCPYCNPNADITKTYFFFEHESFKFRVMPMGLSIASAWFQRFADMVIGDLRS
jgi:phage terminase large subunit GpA-like protein